ncbi:multidrug effflux MFS transporter [Granulosicoccus antarcticus]|uniref:Bcr/CflA family efflux transporter n=1 Tax=Granulosicoccus antarcticus IMCC3135 TaxID=1192854 RepID=A0A2Z2P4Q4_9GAMM|nr:multidrug effflux MFS transporter [Granulosicoccus antarcticus]ASJ74814.1 Bicyclomycin resistance protein [Granulosicoccus antarcticus IMCC3135]
MNPSTTPINSKPLALYSILVLALLSAVAPLATDMYLPGFPLISRDLGASAAQIQMTLTSFLVALAIGQLLIGPLSDRYGRRKPLIIGTSLAIVAGALCIVATDIHTLIALRALQGLGGAAGVVLARAIITDSSADEIASARLFQLMMIIGGLAPVLAPIVGTGIVTFAGWRAIFALIALLSVISLVGVFFLIKESLPQEQRTSGGVTELWTNIRSLAHNRSYVGYTLTTGFTFMVLFSYIASSPFVYQNILGFSPTAYSIAFGINASAMILGGVLSAWLVGTVGPRRLTTYGLAIMQASIILVFICVLAGAGPMIMAPAIFMTVAPIGMVLGNASALAIGQATHNAGTASALLGALQFTLGGIASPLVGLGGKYDALPMALVMVTAGLLALTSFALATPRNETLQTPVKASS